MLPRRTTRCSRSGRPSTGRSLNQYVTDYAGPVIVMRERPGVGQGPGGESREPAPCAGDRDDPGQDHRLEQQRSASRSAHVHEVMRGAIIVGGVGLVLWVALVLLFGAWVARGVAAPVRRRRPTPRAGRGRRLRRAARGAWRRRGGRARGRVQLDDAFARHGRREVLAQNAQLRDSEQHKRDLITMVSHEIRTPLASVIGFTSLLLERDFARDEERRYLEIVDTAGPAARRPRRRLPRRAAARRGADDARPRALRPHRADARAGRLFFSHSTRSARARPAGRARRHQRRSRPDRAGDRQPPLERDQVLACGRCRVRARRADGDRVVLAVADEGIGIAEDDRDRVFEKFFRCPRPRRGSGARASASPSRARSSCRTAGRSASSRSRAPARCSGSSCR